MKKLFLFIFVPFITATSFSCTMHHSNSDEQNLQVLQEKTFLINQGKTLKLDASSGNIEISTWDKNEVYIKISGNNRAKDKVEFKFHNDPCSYSNGKIDPKEGHPELRDLFPFRVSGFNPDCLHDGNDKRKAKGKWNK